MARPRKYVNRDGIVVAGNTGVSLHRRTGRFYIVNPGTQRREYFGTDWNAAHIAHLEYEAVEIDPAELAKREAVARVRRTAALEKIAADPILAAALESVRLTGGVIQPRTGVLGQLDSTLAAEQLADMLGIKPYDIVEAGPDQESRGPRLTDAIAKWQEHKERERDLSDRHKAKVRQRWNEFVKIVGNVAVGALTPEHFRRYHARIARDGRKRSVAWNRDRVTMVNLVLRYVRRKYPDWPWPAGCLEWANSFDLSAHMPDPKNREPMKPSDFKALIAQCRAWASIDPTEIVATHQSGRAKRLQAQHKKRDGIQFEAVLRLGINCALDPVDIARVTWADIKLDDDVPYLELPRLKMARTVGRAVERMTPLLPSTANALEAWQAYEGHVAGRVFRSSAGGEYQRDRVGRTLKRIAVDAGVKGATFKMLRNVGPTLAKKAKLSRDERDALLGHVVGGGTSAFYEGDMDHHYLIPLVNLIGDEYFDGERIEETENQEGNV